MRIQLNHQGHTYSADLSQGIDLSSRYGQKAREPKAWGVPDVSILPFEGEGWVGEVAQGAPVNFFNVQLNPHGNGTHTESIGHIRADRLSINAALKVHHFLARLVRMESEELRSNRVITKAAFLQKQVPLDVPALILDVDHFSPDHDFTGSNAPYFEPALLTYLADKGVKHFLTNLPSVDREEDGGALAAHKAFWDFADMQREGATITELLYVPPRVKEGLYLLNLQVAPIENDASPSRVVVFPLS